MRQHNGPRAQIPDRAKKIESNSHPSDRWQARFYRPGDDQGILDLLVATFGAWPKHEITVPAIDHLRWKLLGRRGAPPRRRRHRPGLAGLVARPPGVR
jgi:hypothetical protein